MLPTNKLLEGRHTIYLEWGEPWPASGPHGNDLMAHIRTRATVHDCINLRRREILHKDPSWDVCGQDGQFLDEFIVCHWAEVVE